MFITETGIADHRDDRRALLIESYFKVCVRSKKGGHTLVGCLFNWGRVFLRSSSTVVLLPSPLVGPFLTIMKNKGIVCGTNSSRKA